MRILTIALAIAGCGHNAESEVNWGALDGINFNHTFLAAKTILLCGTEETDNMLQLANNAMWEWGYASGKANQVFQSWSCQYRKDYDGSVKVSFGYCPNLVVGYHSQVGNHHDITICYAAQKSIWQKTMTHEVGHAWGLCDQYSPSNAGNIAFHPNCDKRIRSDKPQRSVMGGIYNGSPDAPTQDDVQGIRTLLFLYEGK